jgi:hypothetical protein
MSKASMNITNEPSPSEDGTLILQGTGDLSEIDIFAGADNCPTTGGIRGDFAWAQVNPDKFGEIVGSAGPGVGIALPFITVSGVNKVTDVECPHATFAMRIESNLQDINATVRQLSEKQLEIQRDSERKHAALTADIVRMSKQLALIARHLQAPIIPEIPLMDEAPRHTDVRALAPDGQKQAIGGRE